jgi:uncharacterized membrane protein YoaK (UPF0700 family)
MTLLSCRVVSLCYVVIACRAIGFLLAVAARLGGDFSRHTLTRFLTNIYLLFLIIIQLYSVHVHTFHTYISFYPINIDI